MMIILPWIVFAVGCAWMMSQARRARKKDQIVEPAQARGTVSFEEVLEVDAAIGRSLLEIKRDLAKALMKHEAAEKTGTEAPAKPIRR